MPTGYERRDVVQDPNAQSKSSGADTVPLSPVQTPRPASFSRVGERERELADVLGKVNLGFEKYVQKKTEQWKLEGQMAYAEGKTEAEIHENGNRYTMAGFMTMKARTEGNIWHQQALEEINTVDHKMSSQQYQQKLAQTFKGLTDSVAGNDAFTRGLMGSIAENSFPQLVSAQIKKNNEWREGETFQSYVAMGLSEVERYDPTNPESKAHIQEIINWDGGLSKERHAEAVTAMVKLDSNRNSEALYNMLDPTDTDLARAMENASGLPGGLLESMQFHESANDPDAVSPAGAKGLMQVMDGTNADPGFGVLPAQDNSKAERVRVGRDYIAAMYTRYNGDMETALVAYNAGPANADKFLAAGKDYSVLPKQSETQPYVQKIMSDMEGESKPAAIQRRASASSLLRAGFSPSQVIEIDNAFEQYQTRKANRFNADRIVAERGIVTEVEQNGNMVAALEKVQAMKDSMNYDDSWANGMATRISSAQDAYEKEHEKSVELQAANSMGRVATLKGEKQQKAIDLKRTEVLAFLETQKSLSPEAKGEIVRQEMSDYLVKNNVVDEVWKANLSLDLTTISDKDGTIRPESASAFQDYLMLAQKANNGYAAKFLTEDAQKVVAIAENYTLGGFMNPAQALQAASEVMSRKASGQFSEPKAISETDLEAGAAKIIKTFDSSWFGWRNDKTRAYEVYDEELEQAQRDPALLGMLKGFAYNHMLLDKNLKADDAMKLARNEVQNRMEYVMGNIVLSGKNSSIREDMGIADWTGPKAVDKVMLGYMREYGEEIWGKEFNQFEFGFGDHSGKLNKGDLIPDNIDESFRDAVRGVPMMSVHYDSDRKGYIVDRWLDKDRTQLANTAHFIPAAELGDWARNADKGTLNPKNQAAWYDARPEWMRK
jgi:hypothetical protein